MGVEIWPIFWTRNLTIFGPQNLTHFWTPKSDLLRSWETRRPWIYTSPRGDTPNSTYFGPFLTPFLRVFQVPVLYVEFHKPLNSGEDYLCFCGLFHPDARNRRTAISCSAFDPGFDPFSRCFRGSSNFWTPDFWMVQFLDPQIFGWSNFWTPDFWMVQFLDLRFPGSPGFPRLGTWIWPLKYPYFQGLKLLCNFWNTCANTRIPSNVFPRCWNLLCIAILLR